MKNLNIATLAIALGFAISSGAMAETMSKKEFDAGKAKLEAQYDTEKGKCATLSGNPKDICMALAQGVMKTGKAELFSLYNPTSKTRYEARVVKAESEREVAKQRCDAQNGNARDVCMKQADAAETAAIADATVQMKTFNANATADQKAAEAREEAALDKLEARYEIAKERCDRYAGDSKATCLNEAKATFGKT